MHTIHSPAYRQQLTLRSQNSKYRQQHSVSSNQASVNNGGMLMLTKIFTQNTPNSTQTKEGVQNDGQLPLLNSENSTNTENSSNVSEKVINN